LNLLAPSFGTENKKNIENNQAIVRAALHPDTSWGLSAKNKDEYILSWGGHIRARSQPALLANPVIHPERRRLWFLFSRSHQRTGILPYDWGVDSEFCLEKDVDLQRG
jgi:hypothetical protein